MDTTPPVSTATGPPATGPPADPFTYPVVTELNKSFQTYQTLENTLSDKIVKDIEFHTKLDAVIIKFNDDLTTLLSNFTSLAKIVPIAIDIINQYRDAIIQAINNTDDHDINLNNVIDTIPAHTTDEVATKFQTILDNFNKSFQTLTTNINSLSDTVNHEKLQEVVTKKRRLNVDKIFPAESQQIAAENPLKIVEISTELQSPPIQSILTNYTSINTDSTPTIQLLKFPLPEQIPANLKVAYTNKYNHVLQTLNETININVKDNTHFIHVAKLLTAYIEAITPTRRVTRSLTRISKGGGARHRRKRSSRRHRKHKRGGYTYRRSSRRRSPFDSSLSP